MYKTEFKKLGHQIKIERIKRNLTQEQLAEMSNMSTHNISNIETGKTDLKYSTLLQLSKAFNMRACELLDF